MPSVAHEGNPKQDTITIQGGDVLSTAQLDINLTFQGGVTPPTVDSELASQSQSCADVFEWEGQQDGVPFLLLSDSPCLSTSSSLTRLSGLVFPKLRINSTNTCYGVMWQMVEALTFPQAEGDIAYGSSITWRVTFNGVIDGSPRAGIAVWIDDATTKNVATLYALVADFESGVTRLMQYANASLVSKSNGTTLASMAATPSIGQIMSITMDQYPSDEGLSSNGVFSSIYDSTLSTELYQADYTFEDSKPFDHSRIRHSKCNVGFVSIGGDAAGKLEFAHSAITTCANGLTPFMILDSSGGSA